ncbi:MAG: hypothetical protein J0L82_15645 [Deltaproteobacteria bacterium]|jgi:hypothetical protein|nr:hypothetical protein [Deltaproteobacteria bacterium]
MKTTSILSRAFLTVIALLFFSLIVNQPAQAAGRASFEFTCETSEDDFYDWIQAELWPKPSAVVGTTNFGRNLDAAFDILTDPSTRRADWEITLTSVDCQSDVATELRRESLFETIEDAHADGHGRVRR